MFGIERWIMLYGLQDLIEKLNNAFKAYMEAAVSEKKRHLPQPRMKAIT
jgi:hypothetical protein